MPSDRDAEEPGLEWSSRTPRPGQATSEDRLPFEGNLAGRGDDDELDYNDPYDAESGELGTPLTRALLKAGIAVIAVAVFVGVIWYAYSWGTGQDGGGQALPVVRADKNPEKVRPEDPGGMDVPYQDKLVMNENGQDGGEAKVERLLPPPETPQPPEADPSAVQSSTGIENAAPPADGTGATAEDSDSAAPAPGDQFAQVPEADMPEMPPAPSENGAADAEPEAAEVEPTEAEDGGAAAKPESSTESSGGQETSSSADAASTAMPDQAAPANGANEKAATTVRLDTGDLAIQLVALRSEAAAKRAWKQLQGKYPGLLDDQRLSLQSVDIDGKGTFWRVRTGPFPNRATAEDMCAQLKAKGQDCLVVKE
jgi:cell division septation protein DedD